jgi:hypothetical protein
VRVPNVHAQAADGGRKDLPEGAPQQGGALGVWRRTGCGHARNYGVRETEVSKQYWRQTARVPGAQDSTA